MICIDVLLYVSMQATILSSHRQFLRRLDLLDISKGHKGDPLALYMFSDSMEVKTCMYAQIEGPE